MRSDRYSPTTPAGRRESERRRGIRARLLAEHGDRCWLCGAPFRRGEVPTLDHLVPRSHGGPDAADNFRLAHRTCNVRRGRDLSVLRRALRWHPCERCGEGRWPSWGPPGPGAAPGYPRWCPACQRAARPR